MAGEAERRELIRDRRVILGSGAALLGSLLISNGLLDGLEPILQSLPSIAGMAGEAVPDAISSVAGNWLANPTYNRIAQFCAKFASEEERGSALWKAVGRAYDAALDEIEAELRKIAAEEKWSRDRRQALNKALEFFREDSRWFQEQVPGGSGAGEGVPTASLEDLLAQMTDPGNSRLQREWEGRLRRYLVLLDEPAWRYQHALMKTIGQQLPARLTACFVREVENEPSAFQAFSLLLLKSSRESLADLQAGQDVILEGLSELDRRLQAWGEGTIDPKGLLDQVQQLLTVQQDAIVARLERVLRDEFAAVRDELRGVGEKIDAQGDRIDVLGDTIAAALPHIAPPVRPLPTAALGPRYTIFGREREITEALAGLRAGQIVAVYGMTGVGKAALATEVAFRLRDEYGDELGVILLRDQGAVDLAGLCDAVALQCGDTAIREKGQIEEKVALTRQLLASYLPPQEERPVLLIIDNLASLETAQAFLGQVRPAGLPTLVTSQDRETLLLADIAVGLYELTPERSPGEAMALVRDRARLASGDNKAIAEIAGLLGYHPLALVIAAGQIAVQGTTPGRLARRLVSAEARLKLGEGRDRERSVRVALQVAWDALPAAARHTLARLAVCPAPATEPFLALVAEQDEEECATQVGELVRRSLAERLVDERDVERVGLHQLVRDFGRQMIGTGREDAELALLAAADAYVGRYAENTPEAHEGIEAEVANLTDVVALVQQRTAWPILQALADTLLGFQSLQTRGHWSLAIRIGRAGMVAAAAQKDEIALARLTHNTAMIIQDQGDYPEARRLYGEARSIFERLGDESAVAQSLGQLGNLAQ